MSLELLARFQQLLQEQPANTLTSSTHVLLRQLPPETARLLRLCAIPHQFNPSLLLALEPSLSPDEAGDRFKVLSSLSIISPIGDALAVHDEVRWELFSSWLVPSMRNELRSVNERLVHHFSRALKDASGEEWEWLESRRIFHLIGADQEQGLEAFEQLFRQWRHSLRLTGCITLCGLVHEYDSVLSRQNVLRLAYQEGTLQADRRRWDEAEQLFRRVLDDETVSSHLRFKALSRLGMVFAAQNQRSTAIGLFQQALDLARSEPDAGHPLHHVLLELGILHRDSGRLDEAIRLLDESVVQAELRDEPFFLAIFHNSLGVLYLRQGESRRAIAAFERSLAYLERLEDRSRLGQVYSNLGTAHADLRDWRSAERFFHLALELERDVSDVLGQARTLNNLVRVYQKLEQRPRAIDACQQAIALFTSIRERYGAGMALWNLAGLYAAGDQRELARQAYERAIESFNWSHASAEAERVRHDLEEFEHGTLMPGWLLLLGIYLGAGFLVVVLTILVEALALLFGLSPAK